MSIRTIVILIATHCIVGVLGFGVGIYVLPILTAPPAPSESEIKAMSSQAMYTASFRRDLKGSDTFHWGEGTVTIGKEFITFMGKLAPGPDYKLYLSPEYVETEDDFNRLKATMVRVGDVKTFENFAVNVPAGIDLSSYNSVIVWCESFGEFITSAMYRE
ncbi:MAG: DM13 domain-containing protein [Candidatus Thiodiazotropha sp. (ex Lucina aurantia)]|nr:DM13 domain-containing protein [Candidatus Thiodiazotropha taylori]MBT3032539.1 DM13 domain-containing protein [Candidatus Thiodiazotropha sp. (ex Lucina pensylvanica)]MBT3045234.1 DM13 domain-containing protein [Candidatus Thiodiazotropha sp. (ex Codakia orbicularis)]MBV2104664.1 DM13 domain-containing protein [Candidatus Thiodiazotropha sp. (ex Lucina aurantia)]MBT3052978.1 DM13 domain-containing protein [Candidatus Thiodiazotropha sp. (ex Codakia orbicularis)]